MRRLGGWWRLWILLSVLWGLVPGWLLYSQWAGPVQQVWLTDQDLKLLSPEAQRVFGIAEVDPGELPWDKTQKVVMPSGRTHQIFGTLKEFQAVSPDYERVQALVLKRERMQKAQFALLLWLVPSFAVLLFGLGIHWVAGGFRKQL